MLCVTVSEDVAIEVTGPCVIRFDAPNKRRRKVRIDGPASTDIRRISLEQADAMRTERIRMQQMEQAAAE
jgi:hypothetical protein